MRSAFVDVFNHDEDAIEYDLDVQDETRPLRSGYSAVLDWVIESANIQVNNLVLDLGSGTGNLSSRINVCRQLVCVDISP